MTTTLIALEFDAHDPVRLAAFWAELLGRSPKAPGARLPALRDNDFEVCFMQAATPNTDRHRMHFDLTSTSEDDQHYSVDLALSLGGRHLDVGQRGDEGHVVLADPEGNEFCVIEAGNGFLANTARIGGIAGDGLPAVGRFWSEALQWPLVWDQDEETAIQSPQGGTKITWGGPPVSVKTERNRLRWVLGTDRLADEIARLQSLGAVLAQVNSDRAELTDPEGHEFIVTTQ